jgi:hypothetical protein
MKDKQAEMEKFNAISQEEALKIAEECEGQGPCMRSCWNCNGAHEHLKERPLVFTCFACGIKYVSGVPAPILGMRMRGEPVTEETMAKYEQALESAE